MLYSAYRARQIITLTDEGPAMYQYALEASPACMDDAVLLCAQGKIVAVEPYSCYRRRGLPEAGLTDLGDVCLAPGLVNAHCHLELSYLGGGQTRSGDGFGLWMESLVGLLRNSPDEAEVLAAIQGALGAMQREGSAHIADTGSRWPHLVSQAARDGGRYGVLHLLELFGFGAPAEAGGTGEALASGGYSPAPARFLDSTARNHSALSGHALYSTSPQALQAAHAWCVANALPYSMHLAESAEEEQCLIAATGLLYELLGERVLPPGWKAPGVRPVLLADKLGLLTQNTLAVHCVQCDERDAAILTERGACVCLCPQSNAYIGVGEAPARLFARKGVLLCLGTDSAASNNDLSMKTEMADAVDRYAFSPAAVLRMATVNGAQALGLHGMGSLAPGRDAVFSVWDCGYFS
ncbi:amidohydrolase family protein [Desulfovibrio sp. OttesenSCG-928-G15]|nr:amidohydrolase family protein [Desulfovibrio sp. OttesenSCG-928-G15]